MKVPNNDLAIVASSKIENYLLSSVHPIGRSKAAFFKSIGYLNKDAALFKEVLFDIVRNNDVVEEIKSYYGSKYIVPGKIPGKADSEVGIVTVWIIERGEDFPRFVTAYPDKRSKPLW